MMIGVKGRILWIGLIGVVVFCLFCVEVLAQSPGDLERRARQLEQQLQGTTDMNGLMDAYRGAMEIMEDAGVLK